METKKLTCCDLMIGDWVERNGKFIQVENVNKDMINYTPDIPYVQEEDFIEEKDITPIPLTAENLMRNGFIKGIFGTYRLPNTTLAVEIDAYGLMFLRFQNCQICEIKSVSHLQHLMRDLGITKEIVL